MIDKILRKLAPLLPDKVRQWRRSLDLGDAELRMLLEKEILATAHRKLGDFRNKLLLSLPPQEVAGGELHLGTVHYEAPKWHCGISRAELLQNMAVFGRSGAGKTNVVFHLLRQLCAQRIPFLFLDWKRTARHLVPDLQRRVAIYTPGRHVSPFPFNPFIPPPGLDAAVYVNHVVDVMGDAYTLGDAARSVLQKALRSCYQQSLCPSVKDVLNGVEAVPDKPRVRGWKASAIRALEMLAALELACRRVTQEKMVDALLRESAIVELDSLSPSNKKFLLPLLCLWVYYLMLPVPARESLQLVIVVEEAHHVLYHREGARESLMSMLLRQCREIGIGIMVVDQHPSLIGQAALGNTYTTVCLNLKDPKDVAKAGALSLMDEAERKHLSMLPVGHGVVKLQDRWQRPFLVAVPLVVVRKGVVTDDMVAAHCREKGRLSALSGALQDRTEELGGIREFRSSDALDDSELSLVHDILDHPDDGVDVRYKRLGVSGEKGHALKAALVEKGVVEQQRVRVGRTRRVLLRLTSQAQDALGLARDARESLEHEYWKRQYAAKLVAAGFEAQLEAPRKRGTVDVLGTRDGDRVAVEVETGKSDVVWNVRQDLLSGFRVVVVATDEEALHVVERLLAKAGLVLDRVRVVVREGWRGEGSAR